jgi:hypothetical protein
MDKTIELNVTKEDIEFGFKYDPSNCPVARALKRVTGANEVAVTTDVMMWIMPSGRSTEIPTPTGVDDFICALDGGLWVKPFNLSLALSTLEDLIFTPRHELADTGRDYLASGPR